MRAPDGNVTTVTAVGAQTAFRLYGGSYEGTAHSSNWNAGNAQLQQLAADNATWLNVGTAVSADGVIAAVALPPGQYRWNITTTTTAVLGLARVPND